jgi:hypothetical protein
MHLVEKAFLLLFSALILANNASPVTAHCTKGKQSMSSDEAAVADLESDMQRLPQAIVVKLSDFTIESMSQCVGHTWKCRHVSSKGLVS